MKTQTSKRAIWARSVLLVPVLALLIYSCSTHEELEKPSYEIDVEAQVGAATPERSLSTTGSRVNTTPGRERLLFCQVQITTSCVRFMI